MKYITGVRGTVESSVAETIAETLRTVAQEQDTVILAVPGGSSVPGIFDQLQQQSVPWQYVHVVLVDERLVSPETGERNGQVVAAHLTQPLIDNGQLPADQVHWVPYSGEPATDVQHYEQEVLHVTDRCDVVLLSMGEDGHVGSLFPNHASIRSEHFGFLQVSDAPKPPQNRMSASPSFLKTAQLAAVVAFGEEKRQAYEQFHNATVTEEACPAKLAAQAYKTVIGTDLV